jgi:ACS family D-galactonate transporter-like MFS transporter
MTNSPATPKTFRQVLPCVLLLATALLINYVDRGNLSIAAPILKVELSLSPTQLGLLFSSFFWTYTFALFFMGWLVDRFDVNWVLLIGFSLWSVATAATGIAHTFTILLMMRLLLGVGESVAFPSYSKILATHVSESFRGVANGICIGGMKFGPAVGAFSAGLLMVTYGWRRIFLYIGCLSLLWVPLWLIYKPGRKDSSRKPADSGANLATLFSQRSFWGASLGHFCINYLLYFMASWLPLYLVQERHLSSRSMVTVAGIYYSVDALFALSIGIATDALIRAGSSVTLVRKSAMLFGHLLAAIGLLGCATAGTRSYLVWLALIAIGSGTSGYGVFAFGQTIAGPRLAGKWAGFQNGFGNFSGVVGPAITGFLVTSTGHFALPFYITAVFAALGGLAWTFVVGPVEQIKWPALTLAPEIISTAIRTD